MSAATTTWISGPVLRARPDGPFLLREAVAVGREGLLGEVVQVGRDEITVQVYEDTSGLRPGTEVNGSGGLLSVRLGPGILGKVFDGLLRPIGDPDDPYVAQGMAEQPAGRFRFSASVALGERLEAGAVVGEIGRGEMLVQRCLVPPDLPPGVVVEMADPGEYREDEVLCRIRDDTGGQHVVAMSHRWPVRVPRPVRTRLPGDEPMLTGQRIIDCCWKCIFRSQSVIHE